MSVGIKGRRQRLTPEAAAKVREDLATCEWGQRGERYALWAARLFVSENTIQRTVQRWAGRVPDGQAPASRETQRALRRTPTAITSKFDSLSVA